MVLCLCGWLADDDVWVIGSRMIDGGAVWRRGGWDGLWYDSLDIMKDGRLTEGYISECQVSIPESMSVM